jgi:hypothetical protein
MLKFFFFENLVPTCVRPPGHYTPPPNVTFCHTFLYPLPPPNCGRRLWTASKFHKDFYLQQSFSSRPGLIVPHINNSWASLFSES